MMRTTKRFPVLSSLLSLAGVIPAALLTTSLIYPQAATAEPAKAQLTLTVTNIKDHTGALMVAVYDQAGYDADKQISAIRIPVTRDTASGTLEVPEGQYGIKLFHDVDGDGKMGMNPFGMPTEPFAFSNSAPAQFGPAKWDAAKFDVAAPATAHAIKFN
jgi:uncharacterized protein (DUF2141 family)